LFVICYILIVVIILSVVFPHLTYPHADVVSLAIHCLGLLLDSVAVHLPLFHLLEFSVDQSRNSF
jgi:hypothetical protein